MGNIVAEGLRVESVAKGEKRGQLGQGIVVETVEVCEVTALVDLVDVGLLGSERDIVLDFVADLAEERVVD